MFFRQFFLLSIRKIDIRFYICVVSLNIIKSAFIALLFCLTFSFAEESGNAKPDSTVSDTASVELKAQQESKSIFSSGFDNTFSWVGIVLPHHSLRNSGTLHNWPFFPFAFPTWAISYKVQYDVNKLLTLKEISNLDPGLFGLGLKSEFSVELIHLLEFGIGGVVGTAFNYGETATMMGVYKPEKRDYRQDIFMTKFTYGVKYRAGLTIPVLAFLPKSDWTKIIVKGSAELEYNAYTGADDGEMWKSGMSDGVNGYKHKFGGTLIYMLPFERVYMAMLGASVSGYNKSAEFDSVYNDYDPYFKTYALNPMLMFKVSDRWNGMAMANYARLRKYERYKYEASEEPLQKRVGSEWRLNVVMLVFSRKF